MFGDSPTTLTVTTGIRLIATVVLSGAILTEAHSAERDFPNYGTLLDGHVMPDMEVAMLAHSDRLFPVNIVYRAGPVRPLATAPTKLGNVQFESGGKGYDLFDYLATNRVAG